MRDLLPIVIFSNFLHNTFCILHLTPRVLLAEGCDSPYLLGFLVELLQWRLEGEKDDAQVSWKLLTPESYFIKSLFDEFDEWNGFKVAKMVSEAEELCERLANELDVIRARYISCNHAFVGVTLFVPFFLNIICFFLRYWTFIQNTISKKYGRSDWSEMEAQRHCVASCPDSMWLKSPRISTRTLSFVQINWI